MRRVLVIAILAAGGAIAPPSRASESDDAAAKARRQQQKCDAGDAEGCFGLGIAYATGNGVTKDKAKAVQLYQKACDAGEALGCLLLGGAYTGGEGVTQDLAKAMQLYQKACDAGVAAGCFSLGDAYAYGQSVTPDKAKAMQLYQKACDGGSAEGCEALGKLAPHKAGTDPGVSTYTRSHIPPAEWPALEQQALDGSPDAAFRLYLSLDLDRAKLEEKLFWVTIAAENGSVGAQHMLGRYLARTSKDPRLRRRARYWFKRAADAGDDGALDELRETEATPGETPGRR